MKKMKNRKGFTLVELIVVIAILAILAAVAIPVYSNYIKKANEAADYTLLDSVKTAAVFAAVDANHEAEVTKIEFTFGGTTVKINGATEATDISEYIGTSTASKSGATSATWENDTWTLTKGTGSGS